MFTNNSKKHREGDPLGSVQETEIRPSNKCYMYKPESVLENETHKILKDFEIKQII